MLNRVAMIGVPMDLGGGRRGVDMGPSAMRIAGLEEGVQRLGLAYEDRGNVGVPQPESREPQAIRKARFLFEIAQLLPAPARHAWSACSRRRVPGRDRRRPLDRDRHRRRRSARSTSDAASASA
jgi:arginase